MEDMDFSRTLIDEMRTISSDELTEQLIDATHQTSIDDTPPEAGKFSLTKNANEGVVLGEPKVEKTGESRSQPIILDSPIPESETPEEKERSNTEEAAVDLEEEEEELEEDVEIDRPTMVNIDRQTGNNVDRHSTPAEPVVERVYRTLPPFPPNKTQTKRELDEAICKKAFGKITLEMLLSDTIKVSP
ncbi:hypothetical protein DY000_02039624 [Brassica cretica]|uniref:Uncharacterized protein n=1 Tax=Brassica cretica TaxID=69181 RepID=A0ABQ7BI90_BRACR|nr:hypothetical protein DY000_02039624 [Brassica cretica]